LFVQEAHQEMR